MGQGGVFEVGVDLFDDRVAAVDLVGDNSVGVGGGEEVVEAPGVEQGRLCVVRCGVEVGDAAHHHAALDLFGGFSGAECGECDLGDLGAGDPSLGGFVVDGVGVFDGRPRVLVDGGDGGFDCRVQTHGDRDIGAAADRRSHGGMAVERRIHPYQRLSHCGGAAQAGDGGQGVADDPGGSTRRSAGTFAQPLASDHRCAVGGGDRGDQRIQPADPGVAVPGSLFGVAVDFDDGVVDVDQDGAFDPVQQRRAFGQPGQ